MTTLTHDTDFETCLLLPSTEGFSLTEAQESFQGFFSRNKDDKKKKFIYPKVQYDTKLRRVLDKAKPGELREKLVAVPPGMSSTYAKYLNALTQAITISEKLSSFLLNPFIKYLSQWINGLYWDNQDKAFKHIEGFEPNNIQGAINALSECFNPGDYTNKVAFKYVFANTVQVKEDVQSAQALIERIVAIDGVTIEKQIQTISELLDTIGEEGDEGRIQTLTSGSKRTLSKLTFSIAQEVEFFGHVQYRMRQLSVQMNETIDLLKKH